MSRRRPRDVQPCGTPAAYRRHLRKGERPCPACLQAERNRDRTTVGGGLLPDARPVRNGVPWRPYTYRGTGPFLDEEVAS